MYIDIYKYIYSTYIFKEHPRALFHRKMYRIHLQIVAVEGWLATVVSAHRAFIALNFRELFFPSLKADVQTLYSAKSRILVISGW